MYIYAGILYTQRIRFRFESDLIKSHMYCNYKFLVDAKSIGKSIRIWFDLTTFRKMFPYWYSLFTKVRVMVQIH